VEDRRFPGASRCAWIAAGLLVLVAAVFGILSNPNKIAPQPRAGFVDLSHWNFTQDGAAHLAGEWLYFEGRWAGDAHEGQMQGVRAVVPGPWPASMHDRQLHANGFGTYILTLKLPAPPSGDKFAIDTGQLRSAYRLYADGKLIANGGTPAATTSGESANSYSSLGDLSPASRVVKLKLEVSNHVNRIGGVFIAAVVGRASALEHQRRLVEMFALIMVGALFFAASYHFAFIGIAQGGQAHLWFGALAALLAARNFFVEPLARDVVPLIGQDWVWRMDFAITALCLPAAYWFLALSFKRYLSSRFGLGLTVLCIACTIVSLAFNAVIGDGVLKFVEILACTMIVYLTVAIVRSAWDKEQGASLALAGWILVSASIVHDILLDYQVIAGGNVLPFGCVAFFLCLSGALTARSQAAFEKIGNLSTKLKNLNAQLETVVGERTIELRQKIRELETQQIALENSRAAAVSANETKSRFLANMSHELRTPLNAILGFSEIIYTRLFGDSVERYSDYARDIHASGRRLLALIDDILDLSRIEAGKLEFFDVCLELSAQIDAAVRLVEARAAAKSVRLVVESDASIRIFADERALQQILVNLLTNAVKFTEVQGEVRVRVYREVDGSTIIVVEDTGIGINPADMSHVFESFGQARHDIAPTDERGTGLGLPIVKGLVEAHGGTFTIESEVDIGTRAIVSFPPERNVDRHGQGRAA
jgi:signal transduction histidine kinase